MEVKGGPDIVSCTWLGTANPYLNSQSASVPLFTAPSYRYDGNSRNDHGWCEHIENFSDYENRLPRGRTYVRNGSVCHLEIQKGLDRKQTKADVMVKFVDGRWIGISVKDSVGATLTNYSVEKILPTGKELARVRLQVQESAGLPIDKQDKDPEHRHAPTPRPACSIPRTGCMLSCRPPGR